MEFEKQLEIYRAKINAELERAMDEYTPQGLIVSEAMRYSLLAGGKRVRPVIALAVCEALEGDMKTALHFGCALEMIHTYSLIHDDLPCMDDDTLRRGRATCHVKFGEAYALLAGDALLTMAFEYITKNVENCEKAFLYIKKLSYCAGISGMVGGQTDDIKAENERISLEELRFMHRRKTGALIDAAGCAGAIAAGCDENKASQYTKSLGIAFQIKDDILDVEGDAATLGKTLGKDEKNDKSTFVTLLGTDEAKRQLECETAKAVKAAEGFGEKGAFLKELAEALLRRND